MVNKGYRTSTPADLVLTEEKSKKVEIVVVEAALEETIDLLVKEDTIEE